MDTITLSEARAKLTRVVDRVVEDADITVITRRDAEDAVIMSLDYYTALIKTLDLESEPENVAQFEKSRALFKGVKVEPKKLVDRDVWVAFEKLINENHQNLPGVLTEAVAEYVARRRVRPDVLAAARESMERNAELGELLAK